MRHPIVLLLCMTLSLSACARLAESRLNPVNWFGRSTVETVTPRSELRPLVPEGRRTQVVDSRVLIDQIEAMSIDRTPGGAIVTATGIAATQGFFNAQLVLVAVENGVATYDFRVEPPAGFEAVNTVQSRRITAAITLSTQELAGIRTIRVRGAQNARTASR